MTSFVQVPSFACNQVQIPSGVSKKKNQKGNSAISAGMNKRGAVFHNPSNELNGAVG